MVGFFRLRCSSPKPSWFDSPLPCTKTSPTATSPASWAKSGSVASCFSLKATGKTGLGAMSAKRNPPVDASDAALMLVVAACPGAGIRNSTCVAAWPLAGEPNMNPEDATSGPGVSPNPVAGKPEGGCCDGVTPAVHPKPITVGVSLGKTFDATSFCSSFFSSNAPSSSPAAADPAISCLLSTISTSPSASPTSAMSTPATSASPPPSVTSQTTGSSARTGS
mmetsp:Transcript_55570/g.130111  ORF Transcript_55570/g.130111 Transcript_55570/m.130111 type:complete len:222 (+) Transcript_55570:1009-1674(+)